MTALDPTAQLALGGGARKAFERRFAAAARHSRFVRALRIAVPALVAAVLLILLAAWLNPFRPAAPQTSQKTQSSAISGSKIIMELPRLAGFTRDSRAYELHARSAAQDLNAPSLVELTEIRAKMEMQDRTSVELHAPSGVFDSKGERLTLSKNIMLKSSTGHEGRLQNAVVDVRSGQIVSDSAVELKLPNGTLNANRLEMERNGEVIRFGGGVTMTLTPDRQLGATKQ